MAESRCYILLSANSHYMQVILAPSGLLLNIYQPSTKKPTEEEPETTPVTSSRWLPRNDRPLGSSVPPHTTTPTWFWRSCADCGTHLRKRSQTTCCQSLQGKPASFWLLFKDDCLHLFLLIKGKRGLLLTSYRSHWKWSAWHKCSEPLSAAEQYADASYSFSPAN